MKGSEFIMERAVRDLRRMDAKSRQQNAKKLRTRLSKHGLAITEYNAMRVIANYCCQICKKHECDVPNGLLVDHYDDNGFPRGLLCNGCNTVLGIFKDDVTLLRAAVEYLKAAESSACLF